MEKSEKTTLGQPECPIEIHLTVTSALVATLLIFVVISCLLAVLEQGAGPQRSGKRLVIPLAPDRYCSNISHNLQTAPLPDCHQSSILRSPASTGRCRGRKTVNFAETTSVQCIESFYEPKDFYDEPQ